MVTLLYPIIYASDPQKQISQAKSDQAWLEQRSSPKNVSSLA